MSTAYPDAHLFVKPKYHTTATGGPLRPPACVAIRKKPYRFCESILLRYEYKYEEYEIYLPGTTLEFSERSAGEVFTATKRPRSYAQSVSERLGDCHLAAFCDSGSGLARVRYT